MILLIQFRTDQSGWHEIKCVYEAANVLHCDIAITNAASQNTSASDITRKIKKADLVLLGGVGESGYEAETKEAKENFVSARKKLAPVIKKLARKQIPTVGLCFGHQLIAELLGGTTKQDNDMAETGVAEICLTDAGKDDQLLSVMHDCFSAIVGHKVSVTELPDEATLLAHSDTCPIQAFRYQKNIYGFQFHPELNKQTLADRLEMYPEYKDNNKVTSAEKNQTITAERILKRAIDLFA
jgi:GMP synthase-like glutamine amidotransferase